MTRARIKVDGLAEPAGMTVDLDTDVRDPHVEIIVGAGRWVIDPDGDHGLNISWQPFRSSLADIAVRPVSTNVVRLQPGRT